MKIGRTNIDILMGSWFEFGIVWDYTRLSYGSYSMKPRLLQISLGCFAIRFTWGEK